MRHLHFEKCTSTFNEFEAHYSETPLLVSAERQVQGEGQYGRHWFSADQGLALTFDLPLNPTPTLTSLEVAVLLCNFFTERFQKKISLKWPNDLLIEGKKVGGILIKNRNVPMVGIGINLYHNETIPIELQEKFGHLFESRLKLNLKELHFDLCMSIRSHRLTSELVVDQWNKLCSHINQMVMIKTETKETLGQFKGINAEGAAMIDDKLHYSGSLILK